MDFHGGNIYKIFRERKIKNTNLRQEQGGNVMRKYFLKINQRVIVFQQKTLIAIRAVP